MSCCLLYKVSPSELIDVLAGSEKGDTAVAAGLMRRSAWPALLLFLCCADCGLLEAGPGEETPLQPPAPPTATTGELFPWDDIR